jgi:prepilin-type N-terminal cleavage/methylation domain-containing protein
MSGFYKRGFTLSELLISLSVLGLISALAVPAVYNSYQKQRLVANFKETYSTLARSLSNAAQNDTILDMAGVYGFMGTQGTNITKNCSTDASAQGCWPGTNVASTYHDGTKPAMVLPSGTIMTDMDQTAGAGTDYLWIDANGMEGPNKKCKDQFPVVLSMIDGNDAQGLPVRSGEIKLATTEAGYPTWAACTTSEFPS